MLHIIADCLQKSLIFLLEVIYLFSIIIIALTPKTDTFQCQKLFTESPVILLLELFYLFF